jgi:hypothetical protein
MGGLVGFGVNRGIPAKLFASVTMTSMSTRAIFSPDEIWEKWAGSDGYRTPQNISL